MKTFRELREAKTGGMTLKKHAEIKRVLKAEVAAHQAAFHAANEKLARAQDALAAHEAKHPHHAEKQAKKDAKMWGTSYHEPGRDRESTPSGGMGGR